MSTVLVTGAYGFIGHNLCSRLESEGFEVRKVSRKPRRGAIVVREFGPDTDWSETLQGVDQVVHLAARVHARGRASEDDAEYMRVNAGGTAQLAQAASEQSIDRFVFLSSISVLGPSAQQPLQEDMACHPVTAYARSKYAAEEALTAVGRRRGLPYVIVRAPIVYGVGDPGNMERLIRLVRRGVPLPLGAATGKKSLAYVENLSEFLLTVLEHPRAPMNLLHIADDPPVSTADLVRLIGDEVGRRPRLFSIPFPTAARLGELMGRGDDIRKLFAPLIVDSTKARTLTGWSEGVSLQDGMRRTLAST